MADEELTLILRLRDEATKQMKSARAGIVAAGAAIAAAGFAAGAKWDKATKTIVAGTGATGKALKGLQSDYQAVARYGDNAATVIADLNTHLGLQGEELQLVAEAALKAGVNTNQFGDIASQLGLDAKGSAEFLDQLVTASQESGVSVDQLTMTIGRSSARFQAAGGSVEDLTTLVVQQAQELGPTGLRGAMSEIMQEVDKGLIPTVGDLSDVIGDSTDRVEQNYQAGRTWRDTLRETKDAAMAAIGPYGDMAGALGSTASGLALAGPGMLKWIKGIKLATVAQKAFNLVMRLNPIGLIVTAVTLAGLAIYKWRDQIWEFLNGAWNGLIKGFEIGYNSIARIVPGMDEVAISTEKASGAGRNFSDALNEVGEEIPLVSDAIAGGSTGVSLAPSVDYFTGSVEDSSAKLDHWASQLAGVGKEVTLIPPFISTLTGTVEDQSAALGHWGLDISNIGTQLEVFPVKAQVAAAGFVDTLTSTITPDRISGIFTAAFTGGGGVLGALKAIGSQLAGSLSKHFLTPLSAALASGLKSIFAGGGGTLASTGLNLGSGTGADAGGLGAIGGLIGAIPGWGWAIAGGLSALYFFKGWGGPSKAEQEARATFAGFHKGVVAELGETQKFADEVQVAIDQGWDRTLAESRAGFIIWGTDAGKTYDEAFADYERYQNAVKVGNTALMKQIDAEYAAYRNESKVTMDQVTSDAKQMERGVMDSLSALNRQKVQIQIDYRGRRTGQHGAIEGRQHGGPVSAGVPYMVGERGPEMFVPSSSGSVAANKSIPTAEEIGAAVAEALHRVPLVVPQDAVTDAMLRNAPRRQALHGTA